VSNKIYTFLSYLLLSKGEERLDFWLYVSAEFPFHLEKPTLDLELFNAVEQKGKFVCPDIPSVK
jgi:hypothetical protein